MHHSVSLAPLVCLLLGLLCTCTHANLEIFAVTDCAGGNTPQELKGQYGSIQRTSASPTCVHHLPAAANARQLILLPSSGATVTVCSNAACSGTKVSAPAQQRTSLDPVAYPDGLYITTTTTTGGSAFTLEVSRLLAYCPVYFQVTQFFQGSAYPPTSDPYYEGCIGMPNYIPTQKTMVWSLVWHAAVLPPSLTTQGFVASLLNFPAGSVAPGLFNLVAGGAPMDVHLSVAAAAGARPALNMPGDSVTIPSTSTRRLSISVTIPANSNDGSVSVFLYPINVADLPVASSPASGDDSPVCLPCVCAQQPSSTPTTSAQQPLSLPSTRPPPPPSKVPTPSQTPAPTPCPANSGTVDFRAAGSTTISATRCSSPNVAGSFAFSLGWDAQDLPAALLGGFTATLRPYTLTVPSGWWSRQLNGAQGVTATLTLAKPTGAKQVVIFPAASTVFISAGVSTVSATFTVPAAAARGGSASMVMVPTASR